MTVSTIASIAAGITRVAGNQPPKAASVLNSLVNDVAKHTNVTDSTTLSTAANFQPTSAQLRVASQSVAHAATVLAAAGDGAGQIKEELAKLKDIATKAADDKLTGDQRQALNDEFQTGRAAIRQIVSTTKYGSEPLLTGNSTQLEASAQQAASASSTPVKSPLATNFIDDVLFPASSPDPLDLTTTGGAIQALTEVSAAQTYADAQTGDIFALQDGINYASSTLESAAQNQDAARSTLDESDFEVQDLNTQAALQAALQDSSHSVQAQTSKLPSNLIALLGE